MSYTTKASALIFLQNYYSSAALTDITDYLLNASDEEINYRTDTQWSEDTEDQTITMDGNAERFIQVPIRPIISITSITIISMDEDETSLDLSGTNREVRWNDETGMIERIDVTENSLIERDWDEQEGAVFPEGIGNIQIVGKFGRAAPSMLELIANLIILRYMTQIDAENYKTDLISETMGKYKYMMDPKSKRNKENENLTLEGLINYLFSILPKDDKLFLDAI